MDLAESIRAGNRRALARGITVVETGGPAARDLLSALYAHTGRAHIVGATGAPGVGKSTLVNELALHWRRAGRTIGIVAVDPTSPFSGGAILGDRIRMQPLAGDTGIFVRSMANRGRLGGIARATGDAIDLLDAAGFDIVIVETVGAGQGEVEIASAAHTTMVVEVPGMGDDVQAIKAGILEIADVFVVNKADREGVEATIRQLRVMLHLGGPPRGGWQPPILPVVALRAEGVAEVAAAVERHMDHLRDSGRFAEQQHIRATHELQLVLQEAAIERARAGITDAEWGTLVGRVARREVDPYTAAAALLAST